MFKQMLFVFLVINFAFSQSQDSLKTYNLKEIIVSGERIEIDQNEFPVEKDNLDDVLNKGGVEIISKGVFLAQDIYADGLKRGDYTIVVDGERYHNACPMRMDAPITRINPVEVKSIEIVKSSANMQSGLGGTIAINRSVPKESFGFSGNLTQMFGRAEETDFSLLAEKMNQRISLRYVRGTPYKTGDGKSFKDLYGYKGNTQFRFGEGTFYGVYNNIKYTGSIMYSENISFPYLKMDEIKSVVYNSSFSYKDYKLYFNYTSHLMNNNLRVSNMFMETDARNLTAGFVADFFEVYFRRWDADNKLVMNNGMMTINNHLMPEVNMYSGNIFGEYDLSGIKMSWKAGITYYNPGDKTVNEFYRQIHKGDDVNRWFPLAGFSISKTGLISNSLSLGGMLDFAAEAPEAEALYVKVRRMTGKPYWSGNPDLKQPFRTTIRTNLGFPYGGLNLYGSYLFNYVYLAPAISGSQKFQTFGNVNAILLGANLHFEYSVFESTVSYTYGENQTNNSPLLEIQPLHISSRINTPEFYNTKFHIQHTYENSQKRVDDFFNETQGAAWNRIDFGASFSSENIQAGIDVENLLDHNFSKHLSYVRDPFASGMKVVEPGRAFRLNLRYNY